MAKDDKVYPEAKAAFEAAEWEITHDPYVIRRDGYRFKIDMALTKGTEKLCVEIKSFGGKSFIEDLHQAVGQYRNYAMALKAKDPDRVLWLAIPHEVYAKHFNKPFIAELVANNQMNVVTFDSNSNLIVWKPQ